MSAEMNGIKKFEILNSENFDNQSDCESYIRAANKEIKALRFKIQELKFWIKYVIRRG